MKDDQTFSLSPSKRVAKKKKENLFKKIWRKCSRWWRRPPNPPHLVQWKTIIARLPPFCHGCKSASKSPRFSCSPLVPSARLPVCHRVLVAVLPEIEQVEHDFTITTSAHQIVLYDSIYTYLLHTFLSFWTSQSLRNSTTILSIARLLLTSI